jgi:hypothetical protein
MAEPVTHEGEEFYRCFAKEPGMLVADHELDRCVFRNCGIFSTPGAPPVTVRSVHARRTTLKSVAVAFAAFEDVVVDGLKTSGVEFIRSCVFKHVTLKGRIEKLVLRNEDDDDGAWMEDYYTDVDWALDISEAVVKTLDLRNVPGRLVRRDHETQALIRRESVEKSDWQPRTLGIVGIAIEAMMRSGRDDRVVVAPKGDKKVFAEVMEEIRIARERGIADPD